MYCPSREATQIKDVAHTPVGYWVQSRATGGGAHECQQLFTASADLAIEKRYKKKDDRGIPLDIKTFTVFVNYLLVAQAKRNRFTRKYQFVGIGKNWILYDFDRNPEMQARKAIEFEFIRILTLLDLLHDWTERELSPVTRYLS